MDENSNTVVAVLFRASLSIIFRSVSQNYSHYLQRKVHIKAVNIFDTSAQKMFILRDLYLFILKMYDIWYEQKRAASLKVLFPLVWTFWLHLLWTINLPYYELNCRTSINNFFESRNTAQREKKNHLRHFWSFHFDIYFIIHLNVMGINQENQFDTILNKERNITVDYIHEFWWQ